MSFMPSGPVGRPPLDNELATTKRDEAELNARHFVKEHPEAVEPRSAGPIRRLLRRLTGSR